MKNEICCFHCGAQGGIAKFLEKRKLEFSRLTGNVLEEVLVYKCSSCRKISWKFKG